MSNSDDEQYEPLNNSHSPRRDRNNLGAFSGFEPTPRLRYRVDGDLESGWELIPDIDSQSQTEDIEDLLDRSIVEGEEIWQDLGDIADRLGSLSPLLAEENTELEIAQSVKSKKVTPQVDTTANRDSLVGRRIAFFDNTVLQNSEDLITTVSTTMVTTTPTTTGTTTVVTTMSGMSRPIISSGYPGFNPYNLGALGAGNGVFQRPNPYGVGMFQPPQAAALQQPDDAEEAMTMLEFEVGFTLDELRVDTPLRVTNLTENVNEDEMRMRKAAALMDMNEMDKLRDHYNHILTYTCATIEEERRKAVKRKIKEMLSLINRIKVAACDGQQQPFPIPPQVMQQYNPAKIQPLNLPFFNGDISRYKTFKINFDGIIRCTGLQEFLWGPYLYAHLDKQTQAYAGTSESWQGKYEELWAHLDSRFANRWTVAAETIKSTIMSSPPEENNWEKMVEYIDDQLDRMKSLTALDLTNEQLATNCLLMKLPEDFSNAIRNGLRISRKNQGNEDFKFTPEEFRDVMNDTVMAWKITQPHLVGSTLLLNTTIPPAKSGQYPSSQPASQGKNSGPIQKQSGAKGKKSYKFFNAPPCQLCDSEDHVTSRCKRYEGAVERRKRLIYLKKCPECTKIHDGKCKVIYNCRICIVGKHMDYLCLGTQPPGTQQ